MYVVSGQNVRLTAQPQVSLQNASHWNSLAALPKFSDILPSKRELTFLPQRRGCAVTHLIVARERVSSVKNVALSLPSDGGSEPAVYLQHDVRSLLSFFLNTVSGNIPITK